MSSVKVWNDNIYPFVDKDFQGKRIEVPAKGCVTMDYDDALKFAGKFNPPIRDADGSGFDPKSYKMIRIEEPARDYQQLEGKFKYVNPNTGDVFDSEEGLTEALKQHEHQKVTRKKP